MTSIDFYGLESSEMYAFKTIFLLLFYCAFKKLKFPHVPCSLGIIISDSEVYQLTWGMTDDGLQYLMCFY